MKRKIVYLTILIVWFSCERTKTQDLKVVTKSPIGDFVLKLPIIPPSFSYNLIKQDGETFYSSQESDQLFFPRSISIIGLLSDTIKNYKVLYLEPGDDLYPTLKVFSKSGQVMDIQSVCYADCAGGDCSMKTCDSSIKIVERGIIERYLKTVIVDCDGASQKTKAILTKIRVQHISISDNGHIIFGKESNQ